MTSPTRTIHDSDDDGIASVTGVESHKADLTNRKATFRYPEETDAQWTPARPEFSWAANALSLMMPHIEPYFVRSMRRVLPQLEPNLAETVRVYMAQESAHHGQHRSFNQILCRQYPKLKPVDNTLRRFFGWLSSRSQPFNLAFTAASETIAYAIARWAAKRRTILFSGADPVVSSMFIWHLAEEVEHKSVAFDVNKEVGGGTFRYIQGLVSAISVWVVFVLIGLVVMGVSDRRVFYPVAWFRLTWWAITFSFDLLTASVLSTLPGHDPRNLVDPLWYEVWLREYDFEHRLAGELEQADRRTV